MEEPFSVHLLKAGFIGSMKGLASAARAASTREQLQHIASRLVVLVEELEKELENVNRSKSDQTSSDIHA